MPRKPKYPPTEGKTPAAQIEAMNAYRKRKGGTSAIQRGFSTTYSRQEGDRIAAAYAAASLTPAQILRAVAVWIEQGTHPAAVASIAKDAAAYAATNAAIRAEHTAEEKSQTHAAPEQQPEPQEQHASQDKA